MRSSDLDIIKETGRNGEYAQSSRRFRVSLGLLNAIMLGNANLEISGKDNLLDAAKKSKDSGRGLVIGSSHDTNVDVQLSAQVASNAFDMGITSNVDKFLKS